jgi:glycosyltransferase involved in cell wall biosynthesis
MKKILFLHNTLELGGAEMMRLTLLRNIDRNKYDLKLCCIGKKGLLGEKIERLGFVVDELNQHPASLNLRITNRLAKYLRKEKPDIVHSCLFYANFHGRLAGFICGVPHLITEEHGEHYWYKGIRFLPFILANFILSRFTGSIICCSDKLKEELIKNRFPINKIKSIENCLDMAAYKIGVQRKEIRKSHNISDEIVFIIVGSLKIGKGHECLLEAFMEIKKMQKYSFKCFFAGDGPLRDALRRKCGELGLSEEIVFLGNIDNVMDYLNASDIFVLPSKSEGLSVALMEAMLAGLCAIATDVGLNSLLIKTGFNGTLILPGDKDELKNAIMLYLQNKNLIKEYGERSRSNIGEKYTSINRYVKEYCEVWDKCIFNKGR